MGRDEISKVEAAPAGDEQTHARLTSRRRQSKWRTRPSCVSWRDAGEQAAGPVCESWNHLAAWTVFQARARSSSSNLRRAS